MSDDESATELAGFDVALEKMGAHNACGIRGPGAILGQIPYEWLVSIRALLGKYFRGCLDCRGGNRSMPDLGFCRKCEQAHRWMTQLDHHLAVAKTNARAVRALAKNEKERS